MPLDEAGLVLQATHSFPRRITASTGVDVHDIRATDNETAVSAGLPGATTGTSGHQRIVGGYADAVWQRRQWSVSGSVRVDSFHTFDARSIVSSTEAVTPKPQVAELFAGPRLGLVRKLPRGLELTGSAFRAFRGPTLNELYRTSQVGQQTTLADPSLLAERATGFEFGAEQSGRAGRFRASYFWAEVNRPISAVSIAQTATTQTLQRENLGQLRSRGLALEAQTATWHGADASFSYQLAIATVTRFVPPSPVQPDITGKWLPEVPRQAVNVNVNAALPACGRPARVRRLQRPPIRRRRQPVPPAPVRPHRHFRRAPGKPRFLPHRGRAKPARPPDRSRPHPHPHPGRPAPGPGRHPLPPGKPLIKSGKPPL